MKTREQIQKEVREQVTREWLKTGPIDEFVGIFMDQEINDRIARELQNQERSSFPNSKTPKKSPHYDK